MYSGVKNDIDGSIREFKDSGVSREFKVFKGSFIVSFEFFLGICGP